MNKAELIESVSEAAGIAKSEATKAVEAVFSNITDALVNGDSFAMPGFGTFDVKNRAARAGRNPRTGETIQIAASKSAGFKVAKGLKDALNK